MTRHGLRQLAGYLGVMALATVATSCSSNSTGTSGGGAGGNLTMVLTWTAAGDIDVGATTPGGIISANFPGNDPLCTHGGDDDGPGAGGSGTETMACNPATAGAYQVVVENYSSATIAYTLTVQVNGVNYSGFAPVSASAGPMTTIGNGTEIHHNFTL
jgi:hypothetical protein